jgi:hypothetical protein
MSVDHDADSGRIIPLLVEVIRRQITVIEQRDTTITVLQDRVAILEEAVAAEHQLLTREREEKELAVSEAERWYHESLRLEAKLP